MIWYALSVPRQKEFIVESILSEEGFDVRVPVIHNAKRIHRKAKKTVLSAAAHFPSWVFIGFNDDEIPDWDNIKRFSIIRGLVANGRGDPIAFPAHVMGALMRDFHQRPVRYTREVRKKYRTGILAEIISGPYRDRRVRIVPIPKCMIQDKNGKNVPLQKIDVLVEVFTPEKGKEAA